MDIVAGLSEQLVKIPAKQKDSFLLGLLAGGLNTGATQHARSAADSGRSRASFKYTVQGWEVCRSVFLYVYGIGRTRLSRLQKLISNGVCFPEAHGNVGKTPWNVLTDLQCERASEFVKNYASVNGLPMPAAPRGRGQSAPTYLPASNTYVSVHAEYCKAETEGERVSLSSFKRIWHMHHPDVKFMVPTEDVCATCERLRNLLRVELSEDGKVSLSNQLKSHVELAQAERAFYNKCIEDAKASPNTSTHITFDFSENFGIPYHSRQPGPVYFKVLFRINDFGIANEAKKEQVHHLFDETQTIGKDNSKNHGPNCVVSMLDHYLQGHQHARSLHAHCDNCCGQNIGFAYKA